MTSTPERWTKATTYPDMWVDPDDDPRNSDGSAVVEGEMETYADYLADYRTTLLMKCDGLDADFDDAAADPAQVDQARADLAREQRLTDTALAAHPDASERLVKDDITIRELMVHRIEEYARHCGHADLLRECVDGRVGQ